MNIRHFTSIGLLVALAGCEPRPADPTTGGALDRDDATQQERAIEPDNTARNAQDRATGAKTPFDQSESGADIATTAAIRREILKTENLSTNADNIKIMTADGVVTLRGVVASESERDTVKSIAQRIAGSPEKVDVQLEVDPDAEKAEDDRLEEEGDKGQDGLEGRPADRDLQDPVRR